MFCSCYFQVLIDCIRFNYLNCFCLIYRSDYTLWRLIHRLYEMRNYVIKCNFVFFALAWYEQYIPQYVILLFYNVLFQKYTHALFREPYTCYKVESKIWCKVVFPTFWKYYVFHQMSLHIHENHFDERAKSFTMQFLKFDIKKIKTHFREIWSLWYRYDKSPIGIFILYLY